MSSASTSTWSLGRRTGPRRPRSQASGHWRPGTSPGYASLRRAASRSKSSACTPDLSDRPTSHREAVQKVRGMFLQNVRLHLRPDVPLALALSGGIDSSSVACGVRAVEPNSDIHTFSYLAEDDALNEGRWTSAVNAQIGAIPHPVTIRATDLAQDLDDAIRALGEPFGSTSIFARYRVFQEARRQGSRSCSTARRPTRSSTATWGTRTSGCSRYCESETSSAQRSFFAPGARGPEQWVRGRYMNSRLLEAMADGELATLLRHGDRNAMRWSAESRTPFLTTDLAENVLSMPKSFLVDPFDTTKSVLRDAMAGIVPADVFARRDKIGFGTPQDMWMRHLAPQIPDWLDDLHLLPMLDVPAARSLVLSAFKGDGPMSGPVWRILCAARWARQL